MLFFGAGAGRMVAVPVPGLMMSLRLDGWTGFGTMKAIITQLGLSHQVNAQFLHTLRNFIYVYVFGDRIADLQVGGISLANPGCDRADPTGFERVYQYYQAYRLSAQGAPVSVVIGSTIRLRAFLIGSRHEIADPSSGLGQFSLAFKFVTIQGPRPISNNNGAAGAGAGGGSSTGAGNIGPGNQLFGPISLGGNLIGAPAPPLQDIFGGR